MKKSMLLLCLLVSNVCVFGQSNPIPGNGYHYYGPNTSWGEYLKVGGNGRGTTKASVVTTNGNLHLDSKDGRQTYINHYSKGNTYLNTQGGNVGIGTSSPSENLTVSSNSNVFMGVEKPAYSDRLTLGITTHSASINYSAGEAQNSLMRFKTNNLDRLTIDNVGNIGIGTSNPTQKLDVNGGVQSESIILVDPNLGSNSDFTALYREDAGNDNAVVKLRIGDDQLGSFNIGYKYWSTGKWVSTFFVNNYGKVGIGTSTPDAKLAVKGNIHAEEVRIDLSVPAPDYVFTKDYDLLTIEEVQEHIAEQGHLPNIPSATEMETNGVELGLMNMKLLEKIEELTLYTIAQEKKLKTQEEKLRSSDSRLQTLQTTNQNLEARLAKIEELLEKK